MSNMKTIHYLDVDGSPIEAEAAGDCTVFLEGDIYESEVSITDQDGNVAVYVIEQSEGGPILRPRRPRG